MSDQDDTRPQRPRPARGRRKLLVATLGLATLSLVGCGGATSGNLVAPPPEDAGTDDAPETPADDAGSNG